MSKPSSSSLGRGRLCHALWLALPSACAPLLHAHAQATTLTAPTIHVLGKHEPDSYTSPVSVGGKEPLAPREIAQSVSVLTEALIRDLNLSTVTEAANQVIGVTFISNDSTQGQVRSRGYALAVSYDGIPAYNALSGYQQFDLDVYERVEVLRGPAGIFTGSGDPAGVMNLVRKRAGKDFALGARITAGSWNHVRATVDVQGALNADKSLRGRAVLAQLDRDYFHDHTHTRRSLLYGTLDWDLGRNTTLSLAFTSQRDTTRAPSMGLPAWSTGELMDAPRTRNAIAPWSRYVWDTQDFAADLEHRLAGDWVAKVKLSHRPQDFFFKDGYASTGVNPDTGTLNYARRERDYAYERNAVDLYATGTVDLLGRRHRLLAGYNRESFSSIYGGVNASAVNGVPFGTADSVPDFDLPYTLGGDTRTQQSGFYAQARLRVAEPLTLVLGGRLSDFRVRSRDIAPAPASVWRPGARAHDEFTPYGAMLYNLSGNLTLYGSVSEVFIPQNLQRADGSTLDPRTGRQIEVGAKAELAGGRLQAALAVFGLRDRNRAYADPQHSGYYLGTGEVESKGWEAQLSGQPAPGYQVQAGYARMDTVYLKDRSNEGLPFTTWEPRHTLKLWGLRAFEGGALRGLRLGLGVHAVSASQSGNGAAAVRRQGGYAVINAMASYALRDNVQLGLNLNNLGDRRYYTRLGGTNTYNSYGEPRNAALTLRVHY